MYISLNEHTYYHLIEIKHKQVFSLFHTYLTFTTEDSRVVNDSYTQRTSVIKQGKINQA